LTNYEINGHNKLWFVLITLQNKLPVAKT